jgi:hypothetical protein
MNLRDAAAEQAQGLTTEPQKILNMMLRDFDPYLSLRRIPEGDPAFLPGRQQTPPHEFGVWEETSTASTKWVFTLPEAYILSPQTVLARVAAGDASKLSPRERIELLQKANAAAEAAKDKYWADKAAERREEMLYIASSGKSRITHTIDGEKMIVGDTLRPARTHV